MENKKTKILTLFIFCLVLFLLVVIRLIDVQIIHHEFYQKKSQKQRTRIIERAAQRGDIFDRNGNLLATTIDTYSAFTHKNGAFTWIKRKLPQATGEKIKQKDPAKIGLIKEKKRIYPKGQLASQLLGFVGLDNQGLSGIELSYEENLKGKEGKVITEGDPEGRELYGAIREIEPGSDGMNITLTIDENIQYIAEREIKKQIKKYRALSGTCIVMDAETGEILALASEPGFNPNSYKSFNAKRWHPRFLDPFEPGSTFKVITVAAALDEGVISPETMLKSMDTITVGGKVIGNAHEIDWPARKISVSKMLEESINTGIVQVGLKLGPEKFYAKIKDFNFGQRTDFGLYGESRGILRHYKRWYKPDIAMITFGQSIAVTPMQLLSAFSAFANNGIMVKPYLVRKIEGIDSKFVKVNTRKEVGRAISKKATEQTKELMLNVVRLGTGRPARIASFKVIGKTGTAQKTRPGGRGYLKDHYIASFIGLAPFDDPKLICLVIVDDPRGKYWGSTVCGPVFKNVMEYSLRYLNVKPDMI